MTTDEIINIYVKTLHSFSYVSIALAFMIDTIRQRELNIASRLVFTATLVALLAFYNPIMDEGTKIFEGMTAESDSKIDIYLERCRTVRIEGDSGFFDDFMTSLQANFFKILLSFTGGLRLISSLLQKFFIIAAKVTAPVLLGLSAWEFLRDKFRSIINYSLAVIFWPIGYLIADAFILEGIILIGIPNALSSGAGVVIAGGGVLLGMIVFLISLLIGMCIFYILTPILLFTILGGGNPGTTIISNMRTASFASMAVAKPVGMVMQKGAAGISKVAKRWQPSNTSGGKSKNITPAVSLNSVTKAMGKAR
jgi:hypothetical protein